METELDVSWVVFKYSSTMGKVKKLEKGNQKFQCLEVCLSRKTRNDRNLFLNKIITCDEKWIRYIYIFGFG